jgi:hypothetical protein
MAINENKLARTIAWQEGKIQSVNIAQIKEVIRLLLDELARSHDYSQIVALIEKHEKNLLKSEFGPRTKK